MGQNIKSRNGLPFNFVDGITVGGVDLAGPEGSSKVGYENESVKDVLDRTKDGVIYAEKWLVADGVTDDGANLLTALTTANGRKLIFPHRSNVYLASPVNYEGSIDIDLNGSRVIAPNRAIRVQKIKNTYTSASALLSFVKGNRRFTIPNGMSFTAGDYVEFLSNTVYEQAGQNKYGHCCTIISVSGGLANLSHPLTEAFDVNTINVYEGYNGRIVNGTIDQSGFADPGTFLSTAVSQECVSFRGAFFEFDRLQLLGNDYTAVGLYAQATVVRGNKSYVYGHANITGYGSGGRLGYGILVHGQDVVLDQCGGANCKHVLMTGSRNFLDGKVTFLNPVCWSPPFEWSTTVTFTRTEPKWGAPIDSHAGCSEFVVVDPVVHGGNSLINLRNRRSKIIRPILHHYGSNASVPYTFVIAAFEGPVQLHEIIDPVFYLNEPDGSAVSTLPYLYGLQCNGQNESHDSIVIRNPNFVNGGGVFATFIQPGAPFNNTCTLRSVEITGISGSITDGVNIATPYQTGSDQQLWKKVNRVVVSFNNTKTVVKNGVTNGEILKASDVSDIEELIKISGKIELFPAMTTCPFAIELGEQGKAFKMPAVLDFRGLSFSAPKGGIYIRSTDTRVIKRLICDDMEIEHALNETGSQSAHGITLEHGAALINKATFTGSRILKNGSTAGAATSRAVNIPGISCDLSGLVIEGDINDIQSFTFFPQGLRHINGNRVAIFGQGGSEVYYTDGIRVYTNAVPPTRFSGMVAGMRVQRLTATTSGVQEWVFTGAGWVATHTL